MDLTLNDIKHYLQRQRPRLILHGIVFVLQFLTVWWFLSGTNWKKRFFFSKIWVLFWIIVLMTFLELLRFSDFWLKKYGLLHYLGGTEESGGGGGAVKSKALAPASPASSPSSSPGSSISQSKISSKQEKKNAFLTLLQKKTTK